VDDATFERAVGAQVRRKLAESHRVRARAEELEQQLKDFPSMRNALLAGQHAAKAQLAELDATKLALARSNAFARQAVEAHARADAKCSAVQMAFDEAIVAKANAEKRTVEAAAESAALLERVRVSERAEREREAALLAETARAEQSLQTQRRASLDREAALLARAESHEHSALHSAEESAAALAAALSRCEERELELVAARESSAALEAELREQSIVLAAAAARNTELTTVIAEQVCCVVCACHPSLPPTLGRMNWPLTTALLRPTPPPPAPSPPPLPFFVTAIAERRSGGTREFGGSEACRGPGALRRCDGRARVAAQCRHCGKGCACCAGGEAEVGRRACPRSGDAGARALALGAAPPRPRSGRLAESQGRGGSYSWLEPRGARC